METILKSPLVSSLIIATLTGTAYLSVKHYAVYEEFCGKMLTVLGFLFAIATSWIIAHDFAGSKINKLLQERKIKFDTSDITYPDKYFIWIIGIYLSLSAYIAFMYYLGNMININKYQNKKEHT